MKNIQWVLSLFAFMLLSLRVSANEPTKHKLAEELIGILQLSNAVSSHVEQLKETMPELMKNMKLTNYSDTVCSNLNNTASLMTEILNWDLMKEDYIRLYSETFSEDELRGIVAFYGSPAGQAFVNKQPLLTKGTIEINQKRVLHCLPQINQIVAEQQATENGKTINLSSDQVKRLSAVYDVFGKASDEFLSQWIEFIGTHSNAEFSIRVNELMVAVFHDVTKDRPVTELDKDDAYSVMLSAFDPSPPTNVSPKAYGWIKRKSLSDVEAQRIWDAFTNGLRRTEVEFNIPERKAATTE